MTIIEGKISNTSDTVFIRQIRLKIGTGWTLLVLQEQRNNVALDLTPQVNRISESFPGDSLLAWIHLSSFYVYENEDAAADTVREVARRLTAEPSPALMRSSYDGEGDPVVDWNDCCSAISAGVDALVKDAMKRGTSLVLEGVHIIPNNNLLDAWRAQGGTAIGVLLLIKDAEAHKNLIFKRGEVTKKGEEKKINAFARIRKIQDAMFKAAVANDWLLIEQKLEPDPIDIVTTLLSSADD